MLWATFRVLNILCHYAARALWPIFLVLTSTVASVDESCVLRAIASTFEGWGYYYNCLWPLDRHQMLWLILVHHIGSWDLVRVRHVCRGYGLGGCIYTLLFFTLFLIRNHNLHLFLGTFSSQNDISLVLLHSSKNVGEWEKSIVWAVHLCSA